MRADSLGLFWRDEPPPPKVSAEKIKRTPPEPVWLRDDYLPGLEEALRFPARLMNDEDLHKAAFENDCFVFDIESYLNYFLAGFKSVATGKVIIFEAYEDHSLDIARLGWILQNVLTVGFNSLNYDLPITTLALAGRSVQELKYATEEIIVHGFRPSDVLRKYRTKKLKLNHIDLIEVAPLRASLKIYGGRLHTTRMQDLPFHPDTVLSQEQRAIVRWYNVAADLPATEKLYNVLRKQIDLRQNLSNETGIDLRSKSDAQIAESVIADEMTRRLGFRPQKPIIEPGTVYKYQVPQFLKFKSAMLNGALQTIANADFVVGDSGAIGMPKEIKKLKLDINGSIYRMGIGGLHSSESTVGHVADNEYLLVDKDVTSYYPFIILNLGLYPSHLGPIFLEVYRNIVQRRIEAKRQGDKVTADSLKITINGSFGKLGNKYSILYSPNLLIQVTVTGQLSLLLLIESLELAGIRVVSANTDGIVIKCKRTMKETLDRIVLEWEQQTGFGTEEIPYRALFSRDVNNYIAIKEDGLTTKSKGAFSNPWSEGGLSADCLVKNPTFTICTKAVERYLTEGIPVQKTIRECKDVTQFVTVRTVKGGGVKVWQAAKTEFLGKAIRWYYSSEADGEIVYATSGNKVPKSEGARPLMDLPATFPDDIDYEWYEEEAFKMLEGIGCKII